MNAHFAYHFNLVIHTSFFGIRQEFDTFMSEDELRSLM